MIYTKIKDRKCANCYYHTFDDVNHICNLYSMYSMIASKHKCNVKKDWLPELKK